MEKLIVELENCYGISKLSYTFDFAKGKEFSVYSPNGVMKTSFAKTFSDYSLGIDSSDMVFPDRTTKRSIMFRSGSVIDPSSVFVIEPYSKDYKSERVSTLLVNAKLRAKYEEINRDIDEKKIVLLDKLRRSAGLRTDIEPLISKAFTNFENGFFKAMLRIKTEVLSDDGDEFKDVVYKSLFSDKIEKLLSSADIQRAISDYISRYDELLEKSRYFRKGSFNHTNAETIAKNLGSQGFFKANHSVNLVSGEERQEIKTLKELTAAIEQEKQIILTDPELTKRFDAIDSRISANVELRQFRDYLLNNQFLLPELGNIGALKEKIWLSYLRDSRDLYKSLVDAYEHGKADIESIIESAKNQATDWSRTIDIFNSRFSVPFVLKVGNQEQVILNQAAPVVKFEFNDRGATASVEEDDLLKVLSMGERRALYLLNIIFELEVRKKSGKETLLVIDDIADSFDYKNKYAIIEYLKDNSDTGLFHQLILTHNYDFFRSVSGRLRIHKDNRLNVDRSERGVFLVEEVYQRNPFNTWKKKLVTNEQMLIASIPFIRNLAEYIGDRATFKKLTSLLHLKTDTRSILVSEYEDLIRKIITDVSPDKLPNPEKPVIDLVYSIAETIINDVSETIDLEKKICLSIAIRLKAEKHMIDEINDSAFVGNIKRNQTIKLFDEYRNRFSDRDVKLKVLDQVNLMTPENIHLNSFMYEPILDMSRQHLVGLYRKVDAL